MQRKILEMIEELLQLDEGTINTDTLIEDIEEWDSLAHVMIIGELDERFGISIPLDEAVEITSVSELLELCGVIEE